MMVCAGDAIQADYVWNAPVSVYESKLIYYLKTMTPVKK